MSELIRRDRERIPSLSDLDSELQAALAEADGHRVVDLDTTCRELESKYSAVALSRSGD